jgi:hypothetical protein
MLRSHGEPLSGPFTMRSPQAYSKSNSSMSSSVSFCGTTLIATASGIDQDHNTTALARVHWHGHKDHNRGATVTAVPPPVPPSWEFGKQETEEQKFHAAARHTSRAAGGHVGCQCAQCSGDHQGRMVLGIPIHRPINQKNGVGVSSKVALDGRKNQPESTQNQPGINLPSRARPPARLPTH